jgi:hypothetical protein
MKQIADILIAIKSDAELKSAQATAHKSFMTLLVAMGAILAKEKRDESELREDAATVIQSVVRGGLARKPIITMREMLNRVELMNRDLPGAGNTIVSTPAAAQVADPLAKKTKDELKELARARKLPVSGNKDDLLARLRG